VGHETAGNRFDLIGGAPTPVFGQICDDASGRVFGLVVALGAFLVFASDRHDTGHDRVVGVECGSAVTPRTDLQADIFIVGVFGLCDAQILRNVMLSFGDFLGFAFRKEPKPLILKGWLGGLDSNQDNQIQNLMYCQLYDLPAVKKTLTCLTIIEVRRKQVVRRMKSCSHF
jgi:hypothetical protein